MVKFTLIAIVTAFAAVSVAAPAMAAGKKKSAGMCGTYMYFDKKAKACKDKRG